MPVHPSTATNEQSEATSTKTPDQPPLRAAGKYGRLSRGLSRWALMAVVFNSIIGAGVFFLPANLYEKAHTYSLIAIIVCAGIMGLIVLCFAELSSRFNNVGGPYQYARVALGPMVGFEVAWLTWLTRVIGFAAVCNLFAEALIKILVVPKSQVVVWRTCLILTLVAALTLINFIGVRPTAFVSSALAIGKFTLFVLFILIGLGHVDTANFSSSPSPSLQEFLAAVTLFVFAFGGFEGAVVVAGEVRAPRRDYPFALITAIVAIALIYILIQVVCIGTLPRLDLSKEPVVDASAKFLVGSGSDAVMNVVRLGALASMLGSLDAGLFGLTRLPFAIAGQGYLPRIFAATHKRFRTPHASILFSAAIIIVFALSHSFVSAAMRAALTRLITYAITCVALIALRRREGKKPSRPAAFRLPAGRVIASISIVLICFLVVTSPFIELIFLIVTTMLGLIIYFGLTSMNKVLMRKPT